MLVNVLDEVGCRRSILYQFDVQCIVSLCDEVEDLSLLACPLIYQEFRQHIPP